MSLDVSTNGKQVHGMCDDFIIVGCIAFGYRLEEGDCFGLLLALEA